MNKKQPITILIVGTIIAVGALLIGTNTVIYAEKDIWKGKDTMQELVNAIDKCKVNDDNMNWKKFEGSTIYKQEDRDTKKCISERQDLGNNLADYEILHCFHDDDYYKYN